MNVKAIAKIAAPMIIKTAVAATVALVVVKVAESIIERNAEQN
jgi:hypothetical protein